MVKCRIIGKYYSGLNIIAYRLKMETNEEKVIKAEDIKKALQIGNKYIIENAELINDTDIGSYVIVLKDKVPVIDVFENKKHTYKFVEKGIKDGQPGIYVIDTKTNKKNFCTMKEAWEYAAMDLIDGVKAKRVNDRKFIVYSDSQKEI